MKKTISIILILIMLLLPFSVLVNVKAEGITITTDANGKVTNNTGEIVVKYINAKKTEQGYDMTDSDTFKAYKVVDIYYNSQTKEISYGFTTDFQRFLDDSAYASDNTVHGLTIDQYLALTSDDNDNTSGNANSSDISTSSTLNILASKYATFIRKNEDGANPVAGLTMTNGYDDNDNDAYAKLENVVPGSYLILPSSVAPHEQYDDGIFTFRMNAYGVMVANVFIKAVSEYDKDTGTTNTYWQLVNANIYAKNRKTEPYNMLYPFSFVETMNVDFESLTPEEQAILMSNAGVRITASSGTTISGMFGREGTIEFPTNTHASIKDNNAITQLFNTTVISLPAGLTFNYDNVNYGDSSYTVTRDGNDFYVREDELIATAIDQQNAITYSSVFFDILISNSQNFTAGANNTIHAKTYYLKDAYIDIGDSVTAAEVKAALDPELENPTARQLQIQKAIGLLDQELNVVLNGVRIINKNSSNENLNGAVFQAYSDSSCTAGNEIGGPVTINNGVGSFVGINNFSTVYIKQITAPSGYKLYNNIIDLHPVATTDTPASGHEIQNVTLGADSYYEINVVNQANALLPFTGGIGTIVYLFAGLALIIVAISFMLLYRKKDKKVNI